MDEALCLEHNAPSYSRCRLLSWGNSRRCRVGHEGHGRHGQLRAPTPRGPAYQVLLLQECKAGATALSA